MELKEFESNIKTNVDREYIENYLNMIANSDMQLYSDRYSFKGWFLRDGSLVGDYKPSLEEVQNRLHSLIGREKVNDIQESNTIKLNFNKEIEENDSNYVHKIIIKVPPRNIISVAANIANTLTEREISGAFIEIPSVRSIGLGYNEAIVVRCTTEELENTLKAVSSLHILYKISVLPILPIYAKTGSWFGYDQINPNTKETASVDFARTLRTAIDKEIEKIESTDEELKAKRSETKNEVVFIKNTIKDYILSNPTYLDDIVTSVKEICKDKGLSESNFILYTSVLDELDKTNSDVLEEVNVEENIKEQSVEPIVDMEQPPIDFGDSEVQQNNDVVTADDMVSEMSNAFNEQVDKSAEDAISSIEVEAPEPNIEVPSETSEPNIFAPDFVVDNEDIKKEDLENDALENLQNNILSIEENINKEENVEPTDVVSEAVEAVPQIESVPKAEEKIENTTIEPVVEPVENEETKVIPELHPMSETSESVILDAQTTVDNSVNEVPLVEEVVQNEVVPTAENISEEDIMKTDVNTIANELSRAIEDQEVVENTPEVVEQVQEVPVENTVENNVVVEENLTPSEVSSLSNDGLTKDYNKYSELVMDAHVLDQVIPALGITVYDYFENENINSKIASDDEVITHDGHPLPAKEFMTTKILGHLLEVPSLASDQAFMDAYNRRASYEYLFNLYAVEKRKQESLSEVVNTNEKKKGLFGGLFHK